WKRLIDGAPPTVEPAGARPPDTGNAGGTTQHTRAPERTRGEGAAEEWLGSDRHGLQPSGATTPPAVARLRLVYQTLALARFPGKRDLTAVSMRASRRAGLPLAFSAGHHPMPRMSFGPALSLGFGSHGEYVDIDLSTPRSSREVMDALNREL